jgi:tetratricopeptide (TPR) repeat protein
MTSASLLVPEWSSAARQGSTDRTNLRVMLDRVIRLRGLTCLLLVLVTALLPHRSRATTGPTLDEILRLRREGRNREAQQALRVLLPELRGSSDRVALARALAASADASIALGDYESAIAAGREAFDIHQRLARPSDAAWDLNAVGLANLYLGRYAAALEHYRRALELDRAGDDGDGEVTRLNNIGNVHYMQGRYADAQGLYDEALTKIDTRTSAISRERLRKMTLSNQAALFQRLGADERALELYARLHRGETMQPHEEAQLLINQGALFRRLGDPIKALEAYGQAQALFARAQHRDGEIGAWRNTGIAYALDLNDHRRALGAFDTALRLARQSSNRRGEVQALLYRGETLRRMGRRADAAVELQAALDGAMQAGLIEEQWKALYSFGRTLEAEGRIVDARRSYERALAGIESVRSDVRAVALRSEFLADKRDVYDALIARRLAEQPPSVADVFRLIEQSRARTWQDRLHANAAPLRLGDVQSKIPAGVLLLEYWTSDDAGSALLWLSSASSGIVRRAAGAKEDGQAIQALVEAVSRPGDDWRRASMAAGRVLLSDLPDLTAVTRLLIVPDGVLHFVPFEALTIPGANQLLVERVEVSYLPSAAFLLRSAAEPRPRWRWPWQRQLVAFGDPPSPENAARGRGDALPRLSYATEEIRAIAASLPGASEFHLGTGAQKRLLDDRLRDVPVLHFSTHAIADTRDPDRSRVLLAPPAFGAPADYLFLREIYDLDLTGVQLATLSACETERGKVIRGEGVEGFSRALLAAGAASAVTTMWDVADRASADFMKHFYFALAQGHPEAAALRWAKLQFLHSRLAWSHPRYWAGYVLNGDGRDVLPPVVPWIALFGAGLVTALASAAVVYRFVRRRG